jgi:hypothetical protein
MMRDNFVALAPEFQPQSDTRMIPARYIPQRRTNQTLVRWVSAA